MELSNLPFRLETDLVRTLYRLGGRRPSSDPYVSGDGFRLLCDHRFEAAGRFAFDPAAVRAHDLIFCEAWHLKDFLQGPGREIEVPFRVVSHNGDAPLDAAVAALIPSRCERIFGQNCVAHDDRLTAIPIGLENRSLHCNGIPRDFDRLRRHGPEKKPRVLCSFSTETNAAVRGRALGELRGAALVDALPRRNSRAYRRVLARYMFVASPPGNGEDCHRTWEGMYLGVIPIVLRSILTERFRQLGLPLLVLDSYASIAHWDTSAAERTYDALRAGFDHPALWLPYWRRVIREG